MADKMVVMMKLKVDLNCPKCYKKAKKAIRKFPQITDEMFDEKSNTILIKVVCYDPERLMNKLCSKGDGSIKSIVILEPPKPPQPQLMNKLCSKGDGSIKSIVILEPPKPPQPQPQPPQKPKEAPAPAPAPAPVQAPAPAPVQALALTPVPQPMPPVWQPYHCGPYYEAQQYQCYGRPVYENWGGGRQCCHEYTNAQGCSIM
ncbi:PREDICTED: protein PYRICULARIA ORYZAE RESISTANCE 21-like [Camelina sativa]|uniref:Protein PYRICULARIA ORYZAE RESISTANCE 21-like n=1 Tax=Camelina sativa TaxID=90675 RepID=A0ABM0YJI4_CAMSA|nr:PREDICTED: protein PYRICULARIA ORYZAE RESISTANCE 21-like [Camelina sativa]